ncbi:glycosyl transferase family protein [Pseudoxanthobacter sp.]|uniref:glycosyl transferase family protein n=1 Tax=Pseudoxanthobacter sp. TaxID=1925742 RepID=UPI002FE1B391
MHAADGARGADGANLFHRIRLLVALDALLSTGSVSGAAALLGQQTSAMSRLLGELRSYYGDRILTRTGRGMVPTPFAETLRARVRILVSDAHNLLDPTGHEPVSVEGLSGQDWLGASRVPTRPLAVTRAEVLEAMPSPEHIARRMAAITAEAGPQQRLAKYVSVIATAPGRPLAFGEARDALAIILAGEADPVQIGALLAAIQTRGPTVPEIAGFVAAARGHIADDIAATAGAGPGPDLDWPAYLSPNWRHTPWLLLSARLVAAAGYRVLVHGQCGQGPEGGKLELAAGVAGIPVCLSLAEARARLGREGVAYLPLGAFQPQLQSLMGLYRLLATRTLLHEMMPLLNPMDAPAMVTGAAAGARRDLYRDVAQLLGTANLAVVGSIRGFVQLSPVRATTLYRLAGGTACNLLVPSVRTAPSPARGPFTQREFMAAIWDGTARDEQVEATILHTAATALVCLSGNPDAAFGEALARAQALWLARPRH